jgi:excisionase family DNA binding protein
LGFLCLWDKLGFMLRGRSPVVGLDDELVSTGAAAAVLGTSRQHIVDLCERGELPFLSVGTHRRIRMSDIVLLQSGVTHRSGLTRDQLRSLWLHRVVVGKVLLDPDRALKVATRNLERMSRVHQRGQAAVWLDEWKRLLDGLLEGILDALTSRSQGSVELRQNSPFAGLLTEKERSRVLTAFRERSTTSS